MSPEFPKHPTCTPPPRPAACQWEAVKVQVVAEAYTTQPNKETASKVLYSTYIQLAWRVDRWGNKEMYAYEPPTHAQ